MNKTENIITFDNNAVVHLWIAKLSQWKANWNEMASLLDPIEWKRAERLVIPERRKDFILQRGLLRLILSKYLPQNPEQIKISTNEEGKPFLPGEEFHFNLSHSNDLMICGITAGARIGVDIQHIYPIENIERVIKKILSPSEIKIMEHTPQNERIELFFTIWTAKEAFLKALGAGFQTPVTEIDICSQENGTLILQAEDPSYEVNWSIREVDIESGYKSVLTREGSNFQVKRITLTPEIYQAGFPL